MNYSFQHHRHARGDQKARGKVLLNRAAFMDCKANSQTYTVWTEIKILKIRRQTHEYATRFVGGGSLRWTWVICNPDMSTKAQIRSGA